MLRIVSTHPLSQSLLARNIGKLKTWSLLCCFVLASAFWFPAIPAFALQVELPAESRDDPPKSKFVKKGGVIYKQGERYALKCDVYIPNIDGRHPAVLLIHGGAWRSGSKLHYQFHARKLVKSGYVVVNINYRHAPTYEYTDQVEDVKTAVRWMRHHAEEYSIDSDRIAAWGYSAGGHLAALLGTTDQNDNLEGNIPLELKDYSSRVQAVVVGGAPCDVEAIPLDSNALYYYFKTTRRKNPEKFRKASPLTYVSKDDPPFFVFHGRDDFMVPIRLNKALHDQLVKNGVPSTFKEFAGEGHFTTFWNQVGLPESIEFLNSVLKQ